MILLSDGQANEGVTDANEIAARCAAWAATGVTTSTYGLGNSFNEELMVAMARAGGGNHYYGDTADDLMEPFQQELELLGNLCLRDIRLTTSVPDGFAAEMVNQLPKTDSGWRLPDLAWGAEAWALLRVTVPAGALPSAGQLCTVLRVAVVGQSLEGDAVSLERVGLSLPVMVSTAFDNLAEDELVTRRLVELAAAEALMGMRHAAAANDWARVDALLEAANRFDALIVGAGPAGATVATLLARAGWSVALVERQRFPRRKVCGECIAASNLPLLQALGVGDAFQALAGPELRQVTLLHDRSAVTASLPAADYPRFAWGRALGRETLDSMLLEQAIAAGAVVFQPWSLRAIRGTAGDWHCELRAAESASSLKLRAALVVDAHGSWETLPTSRVQRRRARSAADLFAFKANFRGASLPAGAISLLALDGGYGGMVVADGGLTTVACCLRRDRLSSLRAAAPGLGAGDAVEAWLQRACAGVGQALHGALRDGPWLSAGPLDPGVRVADQDPIFRVGNAAGEAHPILGEGMSMALQSAALLCAHLLGPASAAQVPSAARQATLQRNYAASWRQSFVPRMRLAAAFAHLAMRPRSAALLMTLVRAWPGLLTHGARWGGKVRWLEPSRANPLSLHERKTCPPPSSA